MLSARGMESFHASASRLAGGVVAFAAPAGTGKTTLAAALADLGRPTVADDAVTWTLWRGQALSFPLPPTMSPAAAATGRVGPSAGAGGWEPLRLVCLLRRSDAARDVRVEALGPALAHRRLLEHAYCHSTRDAARLGDLACRYADLVDLVPMVELTVPDGLERLPVVASRVLESLPAAIGAGVGSGVGR
jgi:hypothetical protein